MLALGVTVALLGGVWAAAVAPVLDWYEARERELAQDAALARRMAVLAAGLPGLQRRSAEAMAAEPATPVLLEGATDALAGAVLQRRLRELAGVAQSGLSSAEALPAEAVGPYRRIGVRISLTAPWPQLVGFLAAIEAASPRLSVDDLQMQVAPSVAAGEPPLSATLTVQALRAGEPAAAPGAGTR